MSKYNNVAIAVNGSSSIGCSIHIAFQVFSSPNSFEASGKSDSKNIVASKTFEIFILLQYLSIMSSKFNM